jgi:predicted GTPase
MEEKEFKPKKLSMTNTKKELLDSYNEVVKQLTEKEKVQLNPVKIVEQKQKKETVEKVKELSSENIDSNIAELKSSSEKLLDELKLKLRKEVKKYEEIQAAILVKDSELKEIFEIEKSAYTLAALIETQNTKKAEFENEMTERKRNLQGEIEEMTRNWEKEKAEHEKASVELIDDEQKKRKREKEEYDYDFKREKNTCKE